MGGHYKTVTTYQPKSINDSFDDERNALERATQIIINENSIRDYDVWPRILHLGDNLTVFLLNHPCKEWEKRRSYFQSKWRS